MWYSYRFSILYYDVIEFIFLYFFWFDFIQLFFLNIFYVHERSIYISYHILIPALMIVFIHPVCYLTYMFSMICMICIFLFSIAFVSCCCSCLWYNIFCYYSYYILCGFISPTWQWWKFYTSKKFWHLKNKLLF